MKAEVYHQAPDRMNELTTSAVEENFMVSNYLETVSTTSRRKWMFNVLIRVKMFWMIESVQIDSCPKNQLSNLPGSTLLVDVIIQPVITIKFHNVIYKVC